MNMQNEYDRINNSLAIGQEYIVPGLEEDRKAQAINELQDLMYGSVDGDIDSLYQTEDFENYEKKYKSLVSGEHKMSGTEKIYSVEETEVLLDSGYIERKELVEGIISGDFILKDAELWDIARNRYNEEMRTPTSQTLPTSPKALKEVIAQSMSEFKSQQRDYYAKWEEWRGAKEEWLNLAMDEDNLSQRAEWSIEAYHKQIGINPNEEYQMPESTNYRIYETFHQPDYKIPTEPHFKNPFSQDTRLNKILNFLSPERETPRLQSELNLLINNTTAMRDFMKILNTSIFEMKGEITQMRELAAKATQEISSGKPINDWIRLNLSSEAKSLGLDPEKATFQDLRKALSQNVTEPQHVQEDAFAVLE